MLRVIVGKTFQGSLGPAPRDETPERQPPAVVNDPASIAPLLRPLRGKVDFPIMVPAVREQNSSVSDESGIRAYPLNDAHGPADHVRHGRERVLGHPADQLDRGADPRRRRR